MKDQFEVFQLLGETTGSIFPLARDIMVPLFEEYFDEQRFYHPTFMAYQLSPELLTETINIKRAPYTNPDAIRENLADAAKVGFLEEEPGGYRISQKGHDTIELIHKTFYEHINGINQFPTDKTNKLADLLQFLVEEVGKTELSGGTLSFDHVQGGHPDVKAGSLAKVDQLLDDLNAFRDDAHIAAWSMSGVTGQVWETLTFIWNGDASTAEELVEKLPYRSYTAQEYQDAMDKLVELGWSEAGEGGYQLTDTGKGIRETAEQETNNNFFGPWKVFSDEDIGLLGELLNELKETNLKLVG